MTKIDWLFIITYLLWSPFIVYALYVFWMMSNSVSLGIGDSYSASLFIEIPGIIGCVIFVYTLYLIGRNDERKSVLS